MTPTLLGKISFIILLTKVRYIQVKLCNFFKASSDNGCNLHSYMLNREPTEIKYLRTLIDTTHFKAHKKTSKDKDGRCGHTGCSKGYDSASYKQTMPAGFMTQGREQIHSRLDKLVPSLRQMNYQNYMNTLKFFFCS